MCEFLNNDAFFWRGTCCRAYIVSLYNYSYSIIYHTETFFARLLYCWILHCFVRYYIQKSVGDFYMLAFLPRERTIKKEKNDTSSHYKRQKGKHIDAE